MKLRRQPSTRTVRVLAFASWAAVSAAGPAAADAFFDRVLAPVGGAAPCYSRAYTAQHLRTHPDQKVTRIFLHQWPDGDPAPYDYAVEFGFEIRGSSDRFVAVGFCNGDGNAGECMIEGDGGEFRLTMVDGALVFAVGEWLAIEGGAEFSPNLAKSDDRVFRLYPGVANACDS